MSDHENCHVDPVEKPLDKSALLTADATFLGVTGMGCPRCATRVRNGLLSLNGVLYADVYLQNSIASAAYDPKLVAPDNLIEAVANAGNDGKHHYQARLLQTMPAGEAFNFS